MAADAMGASAPTAEKSQPGFTPLAQSDAIGHLPGASMPSQGPEGSYVERQNADDPRGYDGVTEHLAETIEPREIGPHALVAGLLSLVREWEGPSLLHR